MDFFTKVAIPETDWQIDYNSKIAFFGSCFSDNISRRFSERKFKTLANPFGTIYNPLSIECVIENIVHGKDFDNSNVFKDERGESYHCWDAHGSFSGASREECLAKLNTAASSAREFLRKADAVFITFGTSFVYFLKDCGKAVANCHRQRAELFERRMISVDEAAQALANIDDFLHELNEHVKIVFTVSPLRHLSDGAHGNALSKATLLLAVEKESSCVEYFPSYEIVLDELRDYRFYADNMTHLSKFAEDYIFERMVETFCNATTITNIKHVEKFMKSATHRIVDASCVQTRQFATQQIAQAEELEKQIPGLDLSEEKRTFKNLAV